MAVNNMLYTHLTVKAMLLAEKYHAGQYDKNGAPYLFHVYDVACGVHTEDEICVALLHDILEDTKCSEETLRCHFPDKIVEAVKIMTHSKKDSYIEYITKVKQNPIAKQVKLSDIRNNTREDRMSNLDEYTKARLLNKYKSALELLSEN